MQFKEKVQRKYVVVAMGVEVRHIKVLDYEIVDSTQGDKGSWYQPSDPSEVLFKITQFSFNLGDVSDADAAEALKAGDSLKVKDRLRLEGIEVKIDDAVKIKTIKSKGDLVTIDGILYVTGYDPTEQSHHGRSGLPLP